MTRRNSKTSKSYSSLPHDLRCSNPPSNLVGQQAARPPPKRSVVLPSDPDSSSEPILTYATLPIKRTIRLPLNVFGSWCSPVVMRLPPARYTSHPTLNRIPLKVVTMPVHICYLTMGVRTYTGIMNPPLPPKGLAHTRVSPPRGLCRVYRKRLHPTHGSTGSHLPLCTYIVG